MEQQAAVSEELWLTDDDLMCTYRTRSTGLENCIVYASQRNASHGPRLKVTEGKPRGRSFEAIVTIEDAPCWVVGRDDISAELRERVERWVLANKGVLLELWYGDSLDCVEVAERFVKV